MKNLKNSIILSLISITSFSSCYGGTASSDCPDVVTRECEKQTCETKRCDDTKVIKVNFEKEIKLLIADSPVPKQIEVEFSPSGANVPNIKYSTSDSSVATVSKTGLVTPVTPNQHCVITIEANNFKKKIDVYTYNYLSYYKSSGGDLVSCVDQDIEEVILPTGYTQIGETFLESVPKAKKIVIPEGYTKLLTPSYGVVLNNLVELSLPSTLINTRSTTGKALNFVSPKLEKISIAEENSQYYTWNDQICFGPSVDNANNIGIYKYYNGFNGFLTDDILDQMAEISGKQNPAFTLVNGVGCGVESIKDINIPTRVSLYEGGLCFNNCGVETVTMSCQLTYPTRIYAKLFLGCKNLREFKFHDENAENLNKTLSIVEGNLCTADGTEIVTGVNTGVIPAGVARIGFFAFEGRHFSDTKLVIPNNIVSLRGEAFARTNLEKVYISKGSLGIWENNTAGQTFDNIGSYDSYYNSYTYLYRGEDGGRMICDSQTEAFTGKWPGTFALSNPNLVIYDNSETSRLNTQWTMQFRGASRFEYHFNVSAEDWAAL